MKTKRTIVHYSASGGFPICHNRHALYVTSDWRQVTCATCQKRLAA